MGLHLESTQTRYIDNVRDDEGASLGQVHTYVDGRKRFWPRRGRYTFEEVAELAEFLGKLKDGGR